MSKNKRGVIQISEEFFENKIEILKELYKEFTPITVEKSIRHPYYIAYGFCEKFRELKSEETPPTYLATFVRENSDSEYILHFKEETNTTLSPTYDKRN